MKQHITFEQYDQLSDKAKERADEEFLLKLDDEPGDGYYDKSPTEIDIGMMIEFLDEHVLNESLKYFGEGPILIISHDSKRGWFVHGKSNTELCDALWEATKGVLEK